MLRKDTEQSIIDAVAALADAVNCSEPSQVARVFADKLMNQHRTLQQEFFSAIHKVGVIYANEVRTDLRNENAKQFAQYIADGNPHLPLI